MKKRESELLQLLAEATREAYEEGWRDAIVAVSAKATELQSPKPLDSKPSKRGRPPKALQKVFAHISLRPGRSGAEIAKELPDIPERTIRTSLRRLRLAESIYKKGDGWFAA